MAIVRQSSAEFDMKQALDDLAKRPLPTEKDIARHAAEDDSAWDIDWSKANVVYPPPSADEIRALRTTLGLSQAQFARRFGFTIDTIQQYEQGRRRPSGPATSLLRVIQMDPDAVLRALNQQQPARLEPAD